MTGSSAPSLRSCLYRGTVMHHRLKPVRHRFSYQVFSLYLDLDELDRIDRHCRLLAIDRPGLLSFRYRDHGARDGTPLRPWVEAELAAAGIALDRPRIMLLSFPRLFGYVFNPISVYYCFERATDRLAAIVHEVKNTFGGQRAYVLPVHGAGAAVRQRCAKDFHVSPFIAMEMTYRFKLRAPDARLFFAIHEADRDGPLLVATHTGERLPLSDHSLATLLAGNLFMTFKVTAGIHWEALRLWLKGVPLASADAAREPRAHRA
jgi:DUF1365 family protein